MDRMIYYPGFEMTNTEWTKFALLYLDALSPIIPHGADRYLSDAFRKLRSETDLIDVHRPDYEDGYRATLAALEQVETILRNPGRYEPVFRRRDLVPAWRRPETHSVELFRDKYTDHWEVFCLSHGLATQSPEGLYISKDLADIYMTIMAQFIADSTGASVITDQRSLDKYSVFIRKPDRTDMEVLQSAQSVLKLRLPRNMQNVTLDAVIRHRNRPDFREKQRAFRQALDGFLSEAERGVPLERFFKTLGSTWSDLSDDILKIGTGGVTFGLGIWLSLASPSVDVLKGLREVAAGTTMAVGSVIAIRNVWKNTKTKRLARRFFSDLKQLTPDESGDISRHWWQVWR
jgi:hypothetical protein